MVTIADCLTFAVPQGLAWLPLLTMVGLALVGYANAHQRSFFGKDYFLLAHAAMIIWLTAVTMEMLSPTLQCRPVFAGLAYLGITSLPIVWAFFIYHYAFSVARQARAIEILLLCVVPVAVTAIALTNPLHGLFYSDTSIAVDSVGNPYVNYTHGPVLDAITVLLYAMIIGTLLVLVFGLVRTAPQFRLYFAFPVLITCTIFIPNIAYNVFGQRFYGLDPTPFSFFFVLLLFSLLIVTNRVFNIVNVGSELIFANMRSPALIVDADGQIIAVNAVAKDIFLETVARIGGPITDLAALRPAVTFDGGVLRIAHGRRIAVAGRYFDVDAIPIAKPLSHNQEPIGTVLLMSDVTVEEQRYRDLEAELASNMRQLETSTAMQAALREAAEFDPLTRVRNRLSLPSVFAHCTEQAAREQRKVVAVLIDIDHFKRWNDLHGHAAGDRVLRDVARFLEESVSPLEPIFRIGGEEFLLLFPHGENESIARRIASIQASLGRAEFQRAGDGPRITFSAGVAQWPEDGVVLDALLETADRRLYAAKAAGRNRIIAA
ncbi:GGDEF domain-containing protein [Polymorphobacter multimanifer]|uniref:diguanylate cyclase n=1 Tax=Polymorphobacter multimanifer TaxID=1070431 RepID=A0A841L527_9SPHN|nr:diguanylate cyclase [Polymorphobacter multimanifer]MBB6227520.1 diguanylate cyclase (GGDEF)-like protein [Polymorphobacter multimanifer]GGI84589.1 GGDEF domain-containing protein [Polymorphobacter multimanifer]